MKKLPNSPKASVQRLTQVLRQKLVKPGTFKSELESAKDKKVSESIVNKVFDIIDKFLVDYTSEVIDEVCGRIQSKIDDFQFSDESIDQIKRENAEYGDDEMFDAVCRVLSGINKNGKFDELRKYLGGPAESGKEEDQEEKQDSQENSLFGDFFSNDKKVQKILKDSVFVQKLLENIAVAVKKAMDPLVQMQAQLNRIGMVTAKAMLVMVKTHVKYLLETILLKLSMIVLAASNFVLAASNLVLAASNIVLSIANIVLAISKLALAISNAILFASNMVLAVANITLASIVLTMSAAIFALLLSLAGAIFMMAVTAAVMLVTLSTTILVFVLGVVASAFLSLAGIALSMVSVVASGLLSITMLLVTAIINVGILIASVLLAGAVMVLAALAAAAVVSGIMLILTYVMVAVVSVVSAIIVTAVGASALLTLAVLSGVALVAAATLAAFSLAFSAVILAAALFAAAAVTFTGVVAAAIIGVFVAVFAGLLLLLLVAAVFLFMDRESFMNTMVDIAKKSWEKVKGAFGGIEWNDVKGWAEDIVNAWHWIRDLWDKIGDKVLKIFNLISDELQKILNNSGKGKTNGLWGWIYEKYVEIVGYLDSLGDTIIGKLAKIVKAITDWWKDSDVKGSLDKLIKKLSEVASRIMEVLFNIGEHIHDVWGVAVKFTGFIQDVTKELADPDGWIDRDREKAKNDATKAINDAHAAALATSERLNAAVTGVGADLKPSANGSAYVPNAGNPNDTMRGYAAADNKKLSKQLQDFSISQSQPEPGDSGYDSSEDQQISNEQLKTAVTVFQNALLGGAYWGVNDGLERLTPRRVDVGAGVPS